MTQRILLMGDATSFLLRLRQLIERRGMSVSVAGSLPELFDQLASPDPFDLVALGPTVGLPAQFVLDNLKSTGRGRNALMLPIDNNGVRGVRKEDKLWDDIDRSRKTADQIDRMLNRAPVSDPYPLRCGPLIINLENHEVRIQDQLLNLSPTEAQMLHYFARRVGELVRREDVLNAVWGQNKSVNEQIVDAYMKRLRAACTNATNELSFRTIPKMGYQLLLRRSAGSLKNEP